MESVNDAHIVTDPVMSAACPKCGAMLDVEGLPAFTQVQCPTCDFEFQVPARFGSFMLLQLLGAGGMGGVYRARDEGLNREVAIKVMLKSLGDDPQFVETFQREAQAAARLNHPHIAQIYSFGQVHGQPYIVMELVPGGSLDKMMTQGPMDPAAVIHIGAQIADGLREAADAGLVHGDVKPENILFDADKNAKLVDFGLAALQGGPGNDVWGTPFYIAPEKVRRQKSDFRSDIYSLGATLYHAIAGVPPFDGPDATAVVKARFDGPPKTLKEMRGNVIPKEVDVLISRMLEVEPQTRYPTYGSLLGDMRRYLAKAGPVQLATSSKKIMIKGKGPKNMTGVASTTGAMGEIPPSGTVSVGPLPEGMIPVDQIVEEPETEEAASKRGLKMTVMLIGGILGLVLIVGGGILGGMSCAASKKAAAQHAQLERAQGSARASIAKSVSNARVTVERVRAYVPEAMEYAKAAAAEVVAVLGEEVRASMVPPEPDFSALAKVATAVAGPSAAASVAAPAPGASNAVAAATNAVAEKKAPSVSDAVAAAASNVGAGASNAVAAVANAIAGKDAASLSNAVAAALGGVPPQAVAGALALVAQAAAAPEAQAAAAPANGDVHPVVAIVRSMFEDAYSVKAASAIGDQLLADVEAKAAAAEGLTALDQTEALVKAANAIVEKVNNLAYLREITDVPRTVSRLKKTLSSVKADIASLEAMKRQEALDKAKKEKEAAVVEKKRQEAEALKEKAQNEIARVAATEETDMALLKQLQFREANRALKDLTDDLETKGGLDALAIAQERVARLEAFHKYLAEKAVGYKSSRGWAIEAADAKTLTVAGKKIAWVDVFGSRPEIVAELINGLVVDEQVTKAMSLRVKTTLMTNASLCLSLFYKDMPSAVERAKQLAVKAAQDFDADADVIKQLLPAFFTE